jgi:hypothetical protein
MALKAHSRPRGLLAPLYALFVFLLIALALLVLPAPEALAKNVYEMQDSSEGDPGDGVLRPKPEIIDPVPEPAPRTFGVLLTFDGGLDYPHNQPLLRVPLFFFSDLIPARLTGDCFTVLLPAGRWYDAP